MNFRADMGITRRAIVIDGIRRTDTGSPWPGFAPIHALLKPHFNALLGTSLVASNYRSYTQGQAMQIVTAQQAAEIAKVCPPVDEFEKVWQGFVVQHPLLKHIRSDVPPFMADLTDYINR